MPPKRTTPWSEINLETGEWIIPWQCMTRGKLTVNPDETPHHVCLSVQGLELLRELHKYTGHSGYLFPNQRDHSKPMSGDAIRMALNRMDYKGKMTTHGFRALAMTTPKDLSTGTLTFSKELLPERDYLWVGINIGKVYVIGGFGGTGKTQMVIQVGLEVVLGGILSREVTQSSGVLTVLGEEDNSAIVRRTNAKIQAFKLLEKKTEMAKLILIFGVVGVDVRLTAPTGRSLEITQFVDDVIQAANEHASTSGKPFRLIVLDHLDQAIIGQCIPRMLSTA